VICTLMHIDPSILFTNDCVNMIHHVYTFLAFFDNLGFVDVETRGWTTFSSLSNYFVASSFMLVNSLLIDSCVKSHQRLGFVMPYMKYNMFISKGTRVQKYYIFEKLFWFPISQVFHISTINFQSFHKNQILTYI